MGWFSKLVTGYDLDEEQRRADETQRQLEARSVDYAPGGRLYAKIEDERGTAAADAAYSTVQDNIRAGDLGNVSDQVNGAFFEGLQQGADAELSFVKNIFSGIKKAAEALNPFAAIPTWLWIAALLAGLYYLGAFAWLRRYISSRQ